METKNTLSHPNFWLRVRSSVHLPLYVTRLFVDIQNGLLYGALLLWKQQQKPPVAVKQGPAGYLGGWK